MIIPLLLMSFLVGLLIGVTSMGGAALMAPFLILVLGVKPSVSVGTDLVYGAVTKIVGSWVHLKQGTVDLKIVKKLAMGSIPAGIAGSLTVVLLPHVTHEAEGLVRKAIAVLLVLVAVTLIARILHLLPEPHPTSARMDFLRNRGTIFWGAVVGFCVGATSVGSGSLLAPFLIMLFPDKSSKVVGTDVVHAALLVSVTGFLHASAGGVEWHLVPILLAGSIPGVLVGSRLAVFIPPKPLRTGLAAMLLVTGYRMF